MRVMRVLTRRFVKGCFTSYPRFQRRSTTRPTQSGFTIVELLVAMALIILIMTILSQAFVAGLRALRELEEVGDLDEELVTDGFALAEAIALTDERARAFIEDSLEARAVNHEEAAALREQYETICATAMNLEPRLAEVLRHLHNPGHKLIVQHTLNALLRLKSSAATMVELLHLLE